MRKFAAGVMALCLLLSVALADTFPPTSTPTLQGIDVSAWQGEIDWLRVREAGVRIAMIRATEGSGFIDPYFSRNAVQAKAAGIAVGYYHYLTAASPSEAVAQAEFFVRTIQPYPPDCRLAVDFGGGSTLSDAELTACAEAFLTHVEAQTGYGVMLYTDAWAAKDRYGASIARYPIWVANYGVQEPESNGKWAAWVGFQYSDRGDIDGIHGRVDLDQFTREVYLSAPPTPTPTVRPTPNPDRETLHWEAPQRVSVEEAARWLGTTAAELEDRNDLAGQTVQQGQILRYASSFGGTGEAFAGAHVLQPRENLGTLARRYQTTEETLLRLNALNILPVPQGQVLRIPAVPGREDVPAPPSWLLENVVVVQPGQSVADIAAQYAIPTGNLHIINGLADDDRVYAGQLLHLQAYGRDEVIGFRGGYVVRGGDTLVRIARRFGTTAAALYELNNIGNRNLIYPGQVLVVR